MIVTRAQWGAVPPSGKYVKIDRMDGVKIHYVGGRVHPEIIERHDRCGDLVKSIQQHHMRANGWLDIAYNLLACPHGKVFTGRGPGVVSAANGPGLNHSHYAICALLGDSGFTEPTPRLYTALTDARDILADVGNAGAEVKGHRDGYATSCPGDRLQEWLELTFNRANEWPGVVIRLRQPHMRGEFVERWQVRMRTAHDYKISADGVYGPNSRSACVNLQSRMGLAPDGVVGRLTWNATFSR